MSAYSAQCRREPNLVGPCRLVSLKAVAPVQIRSGLQRKQQVKGLAAGHGGQALIIRPSFVRGVRRHRAAMSGTRRCVPAR